MIPAPQLHIDSWADWLTVAACWAVAAMVSGLIRAFLEDWRRYRELRRRLPRR